MWKLNANCASWKRREPALNVDLHGVIAQTGESGVSLRLVMMGTGTFALPTFSALCESPHQVAGLFTQPDRKGRGHHNHPHPMKEAALEHSVPVFQPHNVNTPESIAQP